jgi:putative ABC transport system permease protein
MSILARKLLRTIGRTRGQFFALVLVISLGVMIYISMNMAYLNLSRSQQRFYQENRFADYTFVVARAPESVVARVEAVPGVVKATGRIQKDVHIVKEGNRWATGRMTGYPLPLEGEVNSLQLLSGSWFDLESPDRIGVLVDPQYAQANGITPGREIEVIANGRKIALTVTGVATSPEFVYPLKDAGSLIPEPERFGIIMVPQAHAQQILGLSGQINQILVDLAPGADEERIKGQIEDILEPYGNLASYPRRDQQSHAMLQAELDGLQLIAGSIPFIFFLIAAGIQFIILIRLIRSQRVPIGVMKALGYDNNRIMWHYTGYALAVSLTGAAAGTALGVGLAAMMTGIYVQYFNLPDITSRVDIRVILYSFLITSLVGISSGLLASRSVIAVNPAEAMRPQPPAAGRRTPIEGWAWLWRRLNGSWKMSLRSIFRNRVRFAVTVLGVMVSAILLVFSCFTNDAIDFLIDQNFRQVNRYDYQVRFSGPVKYAELSDWTRWDEVQRMEPVLELPVKIRVRGRTEDELLMGLEPSGRLKRVYDKYGREHRIPEEGILISSQVAEKLGLKVGDEVTVEATLEQGFSRASQLNVIGIYHPMTGSGSFVSLTTANRLLGEKDVVSSVLLKLDAAEMSSVEERIRDMGRVASLTSLSQEREAFEQLLGTAAASIAFMMLFAGLLGLAIVYNTSVMAFNERQRELASMRILGCSQRDVAGLLQKETWIQALLGIALGLPAGKATGAAYVSSFSTELYSFPAIIYPRTYLIAAAAALFFVWIGQRLALRRLGKLDMTEALKGFD